MIAWIQIYEVNKSPPIKTHMYLSPAANKKIITPSIAMTMILYKEALKKIVGHLIIYLCCTIWLKKTRKKPLYVCYIVLTKAFDYLNRDALILKLQQCNVDGKFLNTIKSMFLKSSSRVKWNGKISKPIKNRYGVMQRGVLSPKLFNEFLQDLGKYLNLKYGY